MSDTFSCKLSITLFSKEDILTVQGDFDRIIDVARGQVCFLRVYIGDVGSYLRSLST